MNKILILMLALVFAVSCKNNQPVSDAYGNFETDKTIISAETAGKILSLDIEEGDLLNAGDTVGLIDTMALHFAAEEIRANLESLRARFADIDAQTAVAKQKLENLQNDQKRLHRLFTSGAATQKQIDDIDGAVLLAGKQTKAVNAKRLSLSGNIKALEKKLAGLRLKITESIIVNPFKGTVLTKLAMAHEEAFPGKALYALADMSQLKLRAFVSGKQLPKVKLGKECRVFVDDGNGGLKELKGKVIWISSSAEFTPKTIQTREQRVNLVYAVKILVKNDDGLLKTGMPGEVKF